MIRIHNEGSADSKRAAETLQVDDETNTGQDWSSAELKVTDTLMDDLFVVVGELLPESFDVPSKITTPSAPEAFDAGKHTTLSTLAKTSIVVRRLSHQKSNLCILSDKKQGLCRVLQLPKGQFIIFISSLRQRDDHPR